MESTDDDDDLKLVQASASLLADLENSLPKLLWKSAKSGNGTKVHTQVRRRDLEYVTRLIEPFQGEPQLLDARLKHILPPIVDAYLSYIQLPDAPRRSDHVDLQSAVCTILYTLCKVRGYKVVLGFLSNEPRYLEPILARLEATASETDQEQLAWQVLYVLLLWLSHLLLTPFDLNSISDRALPAEPAQYEKWPDGTPAVALRILLLGLAHLPSPTKAQDAAAMLLVRLVRRPDMQKVRLGHSLVAQALLSLQSDGSDSIVTLYERLGPLRLLSGIVASSELAYAIPNVYRTCRRLYEDPNSFVATNAVAKKLTVKILRNVAILSLRTPDAQGPLLSFFETTGVLEEVIDYLLNSLGDRDTPVRFAAAKAISLIVLDLESQMREDVIQAVLEAFKEDMPRSTGGALNFGTANALQWHGLSLCLAHMLFKRSASPSQLSDIVKALVSALQFEQRTATGSSIGTNVRDAANFGTWSLSRRYTTRELLSVDTKQVAPSPGTSGTTSVIQYLAIELVLSACLDPAGNIRRGSSAALQELVGRHPNQVAEGIALVQTVDYQAVSLRSRAMVDVAVRATKLDSTYFEPVWRALLGWRGLGSADVLSREAAASSLAALATQGWVSGNEVVSEVLQHATAADFNDYEYLHGFVSTMASVFMKASEVDSRSPLVDTMSDSMSIKFAALLTTLVSGTKDFSPRLLRSELPSAMARMLAAYCEARAALPNTGADKTFQDLPFDTMEILAERLLARADEAIREAIPPLARRLLIIKRRVGLPLGCLSSQTLTNKVAIDGAKSSLHGAGRAMALGSLAPLYGNGLIGGKATEFVTTLGALATAMNVEWRIIGMRALQLAVDASVDADAVDGNSLETIVGASHCGLNDYTIDERGDIGSLVRLQAIACTSSIFAKVASIKSALHAMPVQMLHADVLRLSLEKLDRVRLAAAQCQNQHITKTLDSSDMAAVSSVDYFKAQLRPLVASEEAAWKHRALIEGIISAAGISSEHLLQASRSALGQTLASITDEQLHHLMTLYTTVLKTSLVSPTSPLTTPSLSLLAFLLEMCIPQRLSTHAGAPFKWLNLLSAVQKSHHKSNDIPRIAAAVAVYRGLAEVKVVRAEVLKKLLGMLRTNPYPRIRVGVAEVVFAVWNGEDEEGKQVRALLKTRDWMGERRGVDVVIGELEERILAKT